MATDKGQSDAHEPDEELVAYLDGELTPAEAEAVRSRLSRDAAARTRADSLRKTYDLLDYLPSPQPTPTFASRTLTRLDATTPRTESHTSSVSIAPSRRAGPLMAWLLAAFAAAAAGFVGHRVADRLRLPPPEPPTLQQVRLLERLPLYAGVDSIDFLRGLGDSGLFPDEHANADNTAAQSQSGNLSAADLAVLDKAFRGLPPARQRQLRDLDDAFHALDDDDRARLGGVLERYAVWLDRLPTKYRDEVMDAPAADERLDAVRRIKVRVWREQLPGSVKARYENTADRDEADRVLNDYRLQEAERSRIWELARREWVSLDGENKPFPFDDPALTSELERYVATVLQPRLLPGEALRLDELRREAEQNGHRVSWYLYGAWVNHLSEVHPSLPLPRNGTPVTRVEDLPVEFLRKLRPPGQNSKQPLRREFKDAPQHGKWPDFAELIAKEAVDRNVPPPVPLGPCRPGEFTLEVDAVLETLRPKLTNRERNDLNALEGKWPAYPARFVELARKYDLCVPGVTLPGSPQQWSRLYSWRRR